MESSEPPDTSLLAQLVMRVREFCAYLLSIVTAHGSKGPRSLKAILYTRQQCHLCEDAKALLLAEGVEVEELDIDRDERLKRMYDWSVPVVEMYGKVYFKGRIDKRLLRRLIRHLKQSEQPGGEDG